MRINTKMNKKDISHIFYDKQAYLSYSQFDKYGFSKDDWWYNVQIKPNEYPAYCFLSHKERLKKYSNTSTGSPECPTCKYDFSIIRDAFKTNNILPHYEMKCTKSCLWWNWFSYQRISLAKQHGFKAQYKLIKTTKDNSSDKVEYKNRLVLKSSKTSWWDDL